MCVSPVDRIPAALHFPTHCNDAVDSGSSRDPLCDAAGLITSDVDVNDQSRGEEFRLPDLPTGRLSNGDVRLRPYFDWLSIVAQRSDSWHAI